MRERAVRIIKTSQDAAQQDIIASAASQQGSSIINMLDKQGQRCELPPPIPTLFSWLCMINAIIINFGHVNCACQKFKQVCCPTPHSACLHIAHTQCGTTQIHRKQEKEREWPCEWDNIQLRKAGRQAGSNTSQWHHQKRISVIRAEAGRARVFGPGKRETGLEQVGGRQQATICSVILWRFLLLLLLLLAAPTACRLLPLCLLFVSFFAWKITRTKNSGGGAEEKTPYPSHATTVSSNFQLESFAYLAPNEPQSRPPSLFPATLAICSKCGQRILQLLHTQKKGNKSCR